IPAAVGDVLGGEVVRHLAEQEQLVAAMLLPSALVDAHVPPPATDFDDYGTRLEVEVHPGDVDAIASIDPLDPRSRQTGRPNQGAHRVLEPALPPGLFHDPIEGDDPGPSLATELVQATAQHRR